MTDASSTLAPPADAVGLDDIRAALARIRPYVRLTPVMEVEPLVGSASLVLKLEQLQHGGSFKARGAFNTILQLPSGTTTVAAASGGNHGLGVAYAAGRVGVPAAIFVPSSTPAIKKERILGFGAELHEVDGLYPEAVTACRAFVRQTDAVEVHAYDQPAVVAGQGTIGLEIMEQRPQATTVIVAVGGGGLAAGIALALGDRARLVAAEPRACPTLAAALARGGPVDVEVGGVTVDSLGARRIGTIAYSVLSRPNVVLASVEEEQITKAQAFIWENHHLAVEPGAAVSLAALMSGAYVPSQKEHVVVLLCGANVDLARVPQTA